MERVLMVLEVETPSPTQPLLIFEFDEVGIRAIEPSGWKDCLQRIQFEHPDIVVSALVNDSSAGIKALGTLAADSGSADIRLITFFVPEPLMLSSRGGRRPAIDPFRIYEEGLRAAMLLSKDQPAFGGAPIRSA